MRVSARFVPATQTITLRKSMVHPSQQAAHTANTVLLTNVLLGKTVKGEIVEENERVVKPRKEIAAWPTLRYFGGSYVDSRTGRVVEKARAVYMVGATAFYLPV